MAFKSYSKVYDAPYEKVWQTLGQTCGSLKWTISSSKPEQGIIEMKSGITLLCPMGILLSLRVVPVDSYKTQVSAEAKSRGQLVDYGQAGREIKRLFEALDKMVVSTNETAPSAFNGLSCSKCGSPLSPGAKFCRECGEPAAVIEAVMLTEGLNFCSKCGNELDSDMKFCPGCGQPTE